MKTENNRFEETSYSAHANWYSNLYPDEKSKWERIKMWTETDTVNAWLHNRLYSHLLPFTTTESEWLTVGDGNGADAAFLLKQGCKKVVASDISGELLPVAQKAGLITEFSVQNAESITYSDNSFDYVLCKESFHHFPRPFNALHEMIRVARKGVILLEPNDPLLKMPLMMAVTNIFDRINPELMQRFWKNRYSYEPVGNFVYKISEREIEKAAAAIGLPGVAFRLFNDQYIKGVEHEKAVSGSKLFRKVKRKLGVKNILSKLSLVPYGALCAVVLKEKPDAKVQTEMKNKGFSTKYFPKNPYI